MKQTYICSGCSTTFERQSGKIRNRDKKEITERYCTIECKTKSKRTEVQCIYCSKIFSRLRTQVSTNNFCSSSCSASYNNTKVPKRQRKINKCVDCSSVTKYRSVRCEACNDKRIENALDRTIASVIYRKGQQSSRFSLIRGHARTVVSSYPQECVYCGYDTHVEVCHIKDISNFSLDTKLSEVNHPDNLVILCRNHHWEFDHDILSIEQIQNAHSGS